MGVNPPPAKRRKIAAAREHQADSDVEMDSVDEPKWGVVLETSKESYLITRHSHEGKAQYMLVVRGPMPPDASQPNPSTSSIPTADTASKTQEMDTTISIFPEPSERPETSTDDLPPSGAATPDPSDSGTSQEVTSTSKGKEHESPVETPSIPPPRASPNFNMRSGRIIRMDLSEDDFSFENDVIVIKVDDQQMVIDGDGEKQGERDRDRDTLRLRMLRWRWFPLDS